MRQSHILLIAGLFLIVNSIFAQETTRWDDAISKNWPPEASVIEIPSTLDEEKQPAIIYEASGDQLRPLVISLHTWSGGFEQQDSLIFTCIRKNYHYIHPHFRGPNRTFKACGSEYAIQDIDDAISYCLEKFNVDRENIHVIGASGGGYATLLTYMKTRHPVKSFSAWVPISDIEKWYYQSKGRQNKYAHDIAMATTGVSIRNGVNLFPDLGEARKRSPIFMTTPVASRESARLFIYAGIHDGYSGSVPISHSLEMYNKVVADFGTKSQDDFISQEEIIFLLSARTFPYHQHGNLGDRKVHFTKSYHGRVSVTIFEGTHEMLTKIALIHLP